MDISQMKSMPWLSLLDPLLTIGQMMTVRQMRSIGQMMAMNAEPVMFLANMLLFAPNGSRLSGKSDSCTSDMPHILQNSRFPNSKHHK